MKKLLSTVIAPCLALLLLAELFLLQACKEEKFALITDDRVNITGYLETNPQYSDFARVLKITGTAPYLGAYGTYTLFAPTNDAIQAYLQEQKKTSIEEIPVESLKELVRLHLIADTISTTKFTDGKIARPTMRGQYLTTLAQNVNGVTSITINKRGKIVQSNIRVGNGIIHAIDRVLLAPERTLTEEIKANPSLSIFYDALVATGWDKELDKPVIVTDSVPSYVSVFAETNEVFRANNINSFDDLKNKYSKTGDPKNHNDSLYLYVAYRILPGLKYISDIVSSTTHTTSAPLEVISVKLSKDTVLLNEEKFGDLLEKGIPVDRSSSDITTKNGVLHYVLGDFAIKKRTPTPVFWDVTDQPELRLLPSIFRQPGKSQVFTSGTLKDVRWGGTGTVKYNSESSAYFSDVFELILQNNASGRIPWIEFTTPVIIKGKYKVWIGYKAPASRTGSANVFFDGVQTSRIINFLETRDRSLTPEVLEQQGSKRHLILNTTGAWNAKMVGTVDVQTTGRHVLRIEMISGGSNPVSLDMIHFIPIDQNQLLPLFGTKGEVQYNF